MVSLTRYWIVPSNTIIVILSTILKDSKILREQELARPQEQIILYDSGGWNSLCKEETLKGRWAMFGRITIGSD